MRIRLKINARICSFRDQKIKKIFVFFDFFSSPSPKSESGTTLKKRYVEFYVTFLKLFWYYHRMFGWLQKSVHAVITNYFAEYSNYLMYTTITSLVWRESRTKEQMKPTQYCYWKLPYTDLPEQVMTCLQRISSEGMQPTCNQTIQR